MIDKVTERNYNINICSRYEQKGGNNMRKKLRDLRLERKLTHKDMADYIGLVRTSYTNIELGIKNPSKRVERKIKEILKNNDEDLLINETDDKIK
jgi:putative transcriptional regulator